MTESKPPTQIRLFGTSVELEPGETAQWRTVVVAHDGGEGAPQRGTELITELLSG
jgi:hypothetical protein